MSNNGTKKIVFRGALNLYTYKKMEKSNVITQNFFVNKTGLIVAFFLAVFSLQSSFFADKAKPAIKSSKVTENANRLGFDIPTMPNFCAHEHWGSIESNGGFIPELNGFRADLFAGANPQTPTSIWDIILDPYLTGFFHGSGLDPHALAHAAGFSSQKEWWKANPQAALKGFEELATSSIMTGTFQCTCRGIQFLYGVNLLNFNLEDWQKADSIVRLNYADMFSWYQKAMKKAHFTELIRPVHPEFYLQQQSAESKQQEFSFTHTIMRIDPFLDFWNENNKRRDNLAKIAGIQPVDANSWRTFLKYYFDLAEQNHTTGIKSLQAYRRNLDFKFRNDNEVNFRGNLKPDEIIVFQDWVMNECCRLANERSWVHQIHVGTNNLQVSSPLPLAALGKRYPKMKIVMLHCWPFFKEAAFLAKNMPNFYIDNCWTPVLSPNFFSEALDTYLNYVPYNKIMLSHDCTTVEMAVGSSLFTREILEEKLLIQKSNLKLSDKQLRSAALDMLQNNAVRLYGIGQEAK